MPVETLAGDTPYLVQLPARLCQGFQTVSVAADHVAVDVDGAVTVLELFHQVPEHEPGDVRVRVDE